MGSPPGDTKIKIVVNKILAQKNKPEWEQNFYATLFRLTTKILPKAIMIGFLKTWPGLIEGLIKNHMENIYKHNNGTSGY